MDYTSSGIIDKIKRWAAIPDGQPAFSDADLLKMVNEEMESVITPLVMKCNEEFFVTHTDYSPPADAFTPIRLPAISVSAKLREVKLVDATAPDIDDFINVTRLDIEAFGRELSGFSAFYFEGNDLYITNPAKLSGFKIRVWYYERPNELVKVADSAKIATIDTGTNTVTLTTTLPSDYTTSLTYDFIKGSPHFTVYSRGIACSALTSDDLTSDYQMTLASLPSALAVGDYVSVTNESPVVNLPYEIQNLLCQSVVVKVLESFGNNAQLQNAVQKYKQMESYAKDMLSPRVVGEQKIINNPYGMF